MALKKIRIFEPKPDLTAYELVGAMGLTIEYPLEGEFWDNVPQEARRHFVVGLREGEEDERRLEDLAKSGDSQGT